MREVAGNGSTEPLSIGRKIKNFRPLAWRDDGERSSLVFNLSLRGLLVQSNRQESSMTQQISPLRQRMTDDMTIRNMSPLT